AHGVSSSAFSPLTEGCALRRVVATSTSMQKEGRPLNWAPSADAVAGKGRPARVLSADTVAEENGYGTAAARGALCEPVLRQGWRGRHGPRRRVVGRWGRGSEPGPPADPGRPGHTDWDAHWG